MEHMGRPFTEQLTYLLLSLHTSLALPHILAWNNQNQSISSTITTVMIAVIT
jgi:hypothetical protein